MAQKYSAGTNLGGEPFWVKVRMLIFHLVD